MASDSLKSRGQHLKVLPLLTITTAISATAGSVFKLPHGTFSLVFQTKFTYGSGGTNATIYFQTSFDGGETWVDMAAFQFTTASANRLQAVNLVTTVLTPATPTDGTLTVNTAVSGLIGDRVRVKYVTTGTYAGSTTLQADVIAKSNEAI